MRNSKRKNVLQFCRYADSTRPSPKISSVQDIPGAFQNRERIFKVPWTAHLELLQDKVLRGDKPVVAPIEALLPFPLEDLPIVCITRTQHIDGGSQKLETKLKASEQGIPM